MLMFALVISEDRISMQSRRADIISALHKLPEHIREVLDMDEQVVLCLLITLIVFICFLDQRYCKANVEREVNVGDGTRLQFCHMFGGCIED
jgi:hypothetical protein